MTEISKTSIQQHLFTRDTKVDYKKGDPVINCVFKMFDKDLNGSFNDVEWQNYRNYLREHNNILNSNSDGNMSVEEQYKDRLQDIRKRINLHVDAMKKVYGDTWYFSKLMEFEEKHPEICRSGYLEGETIPEDAKTYDMTSFGMGVCDENGVFTGKTYTNGYISGLDKLSEAEREEYTQLLEKSLEQIKRTREMSDLEEQEFETVKEYCAVKDMLDNNIISSEDILNSEESGQSDSKKNKYIELWNSANPFKKEILRLEKEKASIIANGYKEEDFKKLEQLNLQISQLEQASWSVSDMNDEDKKKFNNEITKIKVQNVVSDGEPSVETFVSTGVKHENAVMNVNLRGKVSKDKVEGSASITAGYQKDGKSILYTLNANSENDIMTASHQLDAMYQNWRLSARYGLGQAKLNLKGEENNGEKLPVYQWTKSNEQSVVLSHTYTNNSQRGSGGPGMLRSIDNSLTYESNEAGTSVASSSSANLVLLNNEAWKLSAIPSVGTNYNTDLETFSLSPSFATTVAYSASNIEASLSLLENYNSTYQKGFKPVNMNTLTVSAQTKIADKYSVGVSFNDQNSQYNHFNEYGVSISSSGKYGTLEAGYSYTQSRSKFNNSCEYGNTYNVSWKLDSNNLRRLFGKK